MDELMTFVNPTSPAHNTIPFLLYTHILVVVPLFFGVAVISDNKADDTLELNTHSTHLWNSGGLCMRDISGYEDYAH